MEESEECGASYVRSEVPTAVPSKTTIDEVVTMNRVTCKRTILNVYTGCPRRNGQYFRRVFLMLKYTDITQNTYVQS